MYIVLLSGSAFPRPPSLHTSLFIVTLATAHTDIWLRLTFVPDYIRATPPSPHVYPESEVIKDVA